MHEQPPLPSQTEFDNAPLGDKRLSARLRKTAEVVEAHPDASLPKLMGEAELEAFYRFVNNERVTYNAVMAPHVEATVERCAMHGTVISVEDTTMFQFKTPRKGLGRYGDRTFLAHMALTMTLDGSPLGVVGMEPWSRLKKSTTARRHSGELSTAEATAAPNEQDRWHRVAELVEAELADKATVIHVMDTEADDYDLLQRLVGDGRRFVIRGGGNRRLEPVSGSPKKMRDVVASCPVVCTREVRLSRRRAKRLKGTSKRPREVVRDERQAQLSIGAAPVRIKAPSHFKGDAKSLDLHIVCVREDAPPKDVEPVEWFLMTTEPVETEQDLLAVVDIYRYRWKIEEYFKAIKTGCAFQERQFESYDALVNVLAVFLPIAWNLLRLRSMTRRDAQAPARLFLSEPELTVLRASAEKPLSKDPTFEEAMLAVARMGGHLKRNGRPGWLTLSRGYFTLLDRVEGYLLAKKM
jgi:hypothetical protein